MICVRCGEAMRMTEKDSSSGRDIREYMCDGCGYSDWEDNGVARWQVLSDYRDEEEAERAGRGGRDSNNARGGDPTAEEAPNTSLWNRLLTRLGQSR